VTFNTIHSRCGNTSCLSRKPFIQARFAANICGRGLRAKTCGQRLAGKDLQAKTCRQWQEDSQTKTCINGRYRTARK
jgi:hypothetical protein